MRSPKKTTAAALAGAVALSSAAYGLGSQAGGGSAVADSDRGDGAPAPNDLRPPGPGFESLADVLGVDAGELQDALRDFHDRNGTEGADAFATALADALGKSTDEVRAAFDELSERHRSRFATRLAAELGVSAERVERALDEVHNQRPVGPFGLPGALAERLGLDADDVEAALEATRPRAVIRPHGERPMPLRKLAAALDVTRPQLRDALREVRAGAASAREDRRAELAAFLADRFGLSREEVESALPEPPRFHHRGRPGPGGPLGHGGPAGPGGPRGPGGPPGPGFALALGGPPGP